MGNKQSQSAQSNWPSQNSFRESRVTYIEQYESDDDSRGFSNARKNMM